jgi:hypothetical protein
LPEAIAGIFVWQNQPFVVSASSELAPNDGFLYRLFLREDNKWHAEAVMRLTGAAYYWSFDPKVEPTNGNLREDLFSGVWLGTGQAIGILGSNGVMLISASGSPQWVGCTAPSFP